MMTRFRLLRFAAASLLAVAFHPAARAQSLSPEEQKIVGYVDAHLSDAVALIEQTVNIDSATQNLAGVRRVGQVFAAEFDRIGFKTRWVEMPPEMKRAGHLFAERTGTRGKRLLLIGHIDTVLEHLPFKREGDRARGSGTSDMKGGDVVLLYALKALHSVGALDGAQIIVALTGDEESVGMPLEISRRDLIEAAKRSDIALAFEGAAGKTATVGRRGSSSWRLEVSGQTGHSAGIFNQRLGSGAIFEAARILNAFHEQLKEENLTFNPSVIVGGTDVELDANTKKGSAAGKHNIVPQKAVVEGDLRFITEEQKERARAKMREIVARHLPQTGAQITFQDRYPAMAPTEGNYEVLRQLDRVSRDLGFGEITAYDPGARGAGDISFVAPIISGLDGLGAKGGGAHAPDEFIDLSALPELIKRTAVLIYRLTR
jgi:glutamate carboxypeptidase